MKVLPKNIFKRKEEILKELSPINTAIEDRIDFILKTVWKTFGFQLDGWYVDDAREGEVGDICELIYAPEYIELGPIVYDCRDRQHIKTIFNIVLDNEKYDLREQIPYEWLFEDFETLLIDGKKMFLQWEQDNIKRRAEKRLEKEKAKLAAIQSAKSKLSKEELQALGT